MGSGRSSKHHASERRKFEGVFDVEASVVPSARGRKGHLPEEGVKRRDLTGDRKHENASSVLRQGERRGERGSRWSAGENLLWRKGVIL